MYSLTLAILACTYHTLHNSPTYRRPVGNKRAFHRVVDSFELSNFFHLLGENFRWSESTVNVSPWTTGSTALVPVPTVGIKQPLIFRARYCCISIQPSNTGNVDLRRARCSKWIFYFCFNCYRETVFWQLYIIALGVCLTVTATKLTLAG